jgi:hypothetical protein
MEHPFKSVAYRWRPRYGGVAPTAPHREHGKLLQNEHCPRAAGPEGDFGAVSKLFLAKLPSRGRTCPTVIEGGSFPPNLLLQPGASSDDDNGDQHNGYSNRNDD